MAVAKVRFSNKILLDETAPITNLLPYVYSSGHEKGPGLGYVCPKTLEVNLPVPC